MVKVNLRGTFGYGRPVKYYGPGLVSVPEGLARALGLQGVEEESEGEIVPPSPSPPDRPEATAALIDLLGTDLGTQLALAGFASVEAIQDASDAALLAIDGVGPATLKRIRAAMEEA